MELILGVVFLGIVIGSLLGWVAAFQTGNLSIRLTKLEKSFRTSRVIEPLDETDHPAPQGESEKEERIEDPAVLEDSPLESQPVESVPLVTASKADADKRPQAPATVAPNPLKRRSKSSPNEPPVSETQVGGTYLAWAGALMSILGVCFFLKLLYDRGLIGPAGRITIAYIFGTASIAVTRLKSVNRYPHFAITMLGLGFAIYFSAAFFSYSVYQLWDSGVAFTLTSLTTVAAFATAYRRDSQVLACLALLGAFISLVVLESYREGTAFLFVNIAILDLVACYLTVKKNWSANVLMALWGTVQLGFVWHAHQIPNAVLVPSLIAVTSFGLLFTLFPVLRAGLRNKDFEFADHAISLLTTGAVMTSLATLLEPDRTSWLVAALGLHSAVLIGALVIAASKLSWRSDAVFNLTIQWVVVASYLVNASCRAADWQEVSIALLQSLIVLAIAAFSVGTSHFRINRASIPAILIALIWLLDDGSRPFGGWLPMSPEEAQLVVDRIVLNARFSIWAATSAAFFAAAKLLWHTPSRSFAIFFAGSAIITTIAACDVELKVYHEALAILGTTPTLSIAASQAALWTAYSAIAAFIGLKSKDKHSGVIPAVLVAGSLLVLMIGLNSGNTSETLIFNLEFLIRSALIACAVFCASRFQRIEKRPEWQSLEVFAQIGLMSLLAWEFTDSTASTLELDQLQAGALSVAWSIQAIGLIAAGLWARNSVRRKTGLFLFAAVIGKILFVDTVHLDAIGRILSFVGSGLLLLLGSYLYNRFENLVAQQADNQV